MKSILSATRLLFLLPLVSACASSPGDSPSGSGGNGAAGSGSGGQSAAGTGGSAPSTGGSVSTGGQVAAGTGGTTATSGGTTTATGGSNTLGGGGSAGSTGGNGVTGGQAGAGGVTGGGAPAGGSSSGGTTTGGAAGGGGVSSTGGTKSSGGSAGTAGTGGAGGKGGAGTGGATTGGTSSVYKPAFILGADITITVEDEYWGTQSGNVPTTYTDAGQQKSVEQILKDHGFNFIRVDCHIDPTQAGGYAEGKPEAFRDLAHTIKLGQRAKKIGMGFLLDLHYSHTWTNPSAQTTPARWSGQAIDALETSVYNYTKDALAQAKAAGAMPDMVQIGNEITNGILWEVGHVSGSNFVNFSRLLKAGIRAVREADPNIPVMLHIEKCNNTETTRWWLDGVLAQGVAFDIFGQSCYAPTKNPDGSVKHPGYQGTPAEWKATFATLTTAYPNLKFVIAEYSSEQRAANDVMFQIPNKRGLGTFSWDPTRSYDTHPNVPLFSNNPWNVYTTVPELMALYDQMAKDYGLR